MFPLYVRIQMNLCSVQLYYKHHNMSCWATVSQTPISHINNSNNCCRERGFINTFDQLHYIIDNKMIVFSLIVPVRMVFSVFSYCYVGRWLLYLMLCQPASCCSNCSPYVLYWDIYPPLFLFLSSLSSTTLSHHTARPMQSCC